MHACGTVDSLYWRLGDRKQQQEEGLDDIRVCVLMRYSLRGMKQHKAAVVQYFMYFMVSAACGGKISWQSSKSRSGWYQEAQGASFEPVLGTMRL